MERKVDLQAGGVNGRHDEGAFGCHIILGQPEGLLDYLGNHWCWCPVAEDLLDDLSGIGHFVQDLASDGGFQVWPHPGLLFPNLQAV